MTAEKKSIRYISRSVFFIIVLALVITVIMQHSRINALIKGAENIQPQKEEDIEKYKTEIDKLKSQIADMQAWQDYLEDALNDAGRSPRPAPQNTPQDNRIVENTNRPMNNPAVRDAPRSSMTSRYDALAKEIGLSEDTKSQLLDLFSEMQIEIMEKMPGRGGFPPEMTDREAMMQQVQEISSKYNEKISELLSPDELYAFKEYQNSEQERMLVTIFNNSIISLDKEREKDLIAAMYNAKQANPDTKTETDALSLLGGRGRMSIIPDDEGKLNSIYVESAREVLTEDEMESFEKGLNSVQSGFGRGRGGRFNRFPPPK